MTSVKETKEEAKSPPADLQSPVVSAPAASVDPHLARFQDAIIAELRVAGQNREGREYKILGSLGKGKFALVFKAERDGRDYALKKVQVRALFVRERRLRGVR
jgi:hypothetical protein